MSTPAGAVMPPAYGAWVVAEPITCPRCALSFEPTARLRAEIEAEVEARLASESASREAALLRRQRDLEQRERQATLDIEERVNAQLAAAQQTLRAEVEQRAEQRHRARADAELATMREQLGLATAAATAASRKEAEMLRRQRELEQRERDAELAVERALADELPKLTARAAAQANEQAALERDAAALREREQRLRNEQLEKTIEDLRRQAQQGSQQRQGEAQETSLRDQLASAFVYDDIVDVATGVRGADLLQRVRDDLGGEAGTIIWESKRTKAWSDAWLGKLRDDQRATGANVAVVVTQALPAGVTQFAAIGGTWVCAWPYAAALATVLRAGLVEIAQARRAGESRGEKADLLFDYLTGVEFRNRVAGVVEALTEMREDLDGERRAMERLWKQREKQLVRAQTNLAAFYGDLRGIAGRKLAVLESLELPVERRLEPATPEPVAAAPSIPNWADDDDSGAVAGDATTPPELQGLLYSLLPEDGSPSASPALVDQFIAEAARTLEIRVDEAAFNRCRDALVDRGMVRRPKGRGAPLARRLPDGPGPLFASR